MKIAWIDRHYGNGPGLHKKELEEYLSKYGLKFKVDIEENLERFNEKFGSLNNYKTLLLHGGIKRQEEYLDQIPRNHPNLEIFLLSCNPEDYSKNEKKGLKTIAVSYALSEVIEESELGELIKKLFKD